MIRAVLFDFGGVVIRTPFEMAAGLERRLGLAPGSLALHGPFRPEADEPWRRVQAGSLHERDYWDYQGERLASLVGESSDPVRHLIDALYETSRDEVLRPTTLQLRRDLVEAELIVAVLTNDLARFHDPQWIDAMDVHRLFEPFVDLSHEPALKPDPAAYTAAITAVGLVPDEILFVDDQPVNVEGARTAGMEAIHFDILDPSGSADLVRRRVGLA